MASIQVNSALAAASRGEACETCGGVATVAGAWPFGLAPVPEGFAYRPAGRARLKVTGQGKNLLLPAEPS